jgi:hypothetical protein
MNKILITLGYNAKVIIPDDVDSGTIIAALARATMVESHGYGDEEKFTPTDADFSVRRIPASRLVEDEDGKARIEAEQLRRTLEATQKALLASNEKVKALEAAAA